MWRCRGVVAAILAPFSRSEFRRPWISLADTATGREVGDSCGGEGWRCAESPQDRCSGGGGRKIGATERSDGHKSWRDGSPSLESRSSSVYVGDLRVDNRETSTLVCPTLVAER